MAGPGLLSSRGRRSRACARVLSATPLVAVLVFFSASRANCVRKLAGSARQRQSPRHTRQEPRLHRPSARVVSVGGAGRAGRQESRSLEGRRQGGEAGWVGEGEKVVGRLWRAPRGPARQSRPPVAVGPLFPRAWSLKGLGPQPPAPPRVLRNPGLPSARL